MEEEVVVGAVEEEVKGARRSDNGENDDKMKSSEALVFLLLQIA